MTRQLTKSIDYRKNYLCDFHLRRRRCNQKSSLLVYLICHVCCVDRDRWISTTCTTSTGSPSASTTRTATGSQTSFSWPRRVTPSALHSSRYKKAVLEFLNNRNRVGIGLSYRSARLHTLAELVPRNRFLGSLKV